MIKLIKEYWGTLEHPFLKVASVLIGAIALSIAALLVTGLFLGWVFSYIVLGLVAFVFLIICAIVTCEALHDFFYYRNRRR